MRALIIVLAFFGGAASSMAPEEDHAPTRLAQLEAGLADHASTLITHEATIEAQRKLIGRLSATLDAALARINALEAGAVGDAAVPLTGSTGKRRLSSNRRSGATYITGNRVEASIMNVTGTLYIEGGVIYQGREWGPFEPSPLPTPAPTSSPTPQPTPEPTVAPTGGPCSLFEGATSPGSYSSMKAGAAPSTVAWSGAFSLAITLTMPASLASIGAWGGLLGSDVGCQFPYPFFNSQGFWFERQCSPHPRIGGLALSNFAGGETYTVGVEHDGGGRYTLTAVLGSTGAEVASNSFDYAYVWENPVTVVGLGLCGSSCTSEHFPGVVTCVGFKEL